MILVDTNIIVDIITNDSVWSDWSQQQLDSLSMLESLCINPIIYAELSIPCQSLEDLEKMLQLVQLEIQPLPKEALFLAGKAFLKYRKSKGIKTGVLSDFFIGAHAAVSKMRLITRDKDRYTHYFPNLDIISP